MPRVIGADTADAIDLGELIEALETGPFHPEDEECFASWAPALKKLANNRRFLADFVLEELKQRCAGQTRLNQYGPQVIMLYGRSRDFLIRANFWPSMEDSAVQASGSDSFFYELPHDHNFSFLTVGYLGSGYWSDFYEYDYGSVAGFTGESVALTFVERSRLDLGKVMLYRAHRDVHSQLPPDEMSVSINIMGLSPAQAFRDQYCFDVKRGEIAGILTQTTVEPMLALAACYGGGNGRDLVEAFANRHPSDRIRFAAVRALASAAGGVDGRLAVYEGAASSSNRFLSEMGRQEVDRLQRSRRWIEAAQPDA